MKQLRMMLALLLLLAVFAGCAPAAQPLGDILLTVPWQDGEESYYNVQTTDGTLLGTAFWRWDKSASGWLQTYEVDLGSRTDKGETVLNTHLLPVSAWRTVGEARYEAVYSPGLAVITTTVGTTVTVKELALGAAALDNDQSLQTQRALPLAQGLAFSYLNVIPTTSASAVIRVDVDGPVTVTVPAGTFKAWHMTMSIGSLKQEAWYAVEQPHLMLRYRNNAAGSAFELRTWRASAGAALQGSSAPAPDPSALANEPVTLKMNWPYMLLSLLFQVPVMIGIALVAGWLIHKRLGVSWRIFFYGAVAFILSQIIHLPLNWLIGLLGSGSNGVSAWPLPLTALVAGASAGLCEQGANWLAVRYIWRDIKTYAQGLQFGAGHGAVEAVITGVLVLVTLINIIALYLLGTQRFGLAGDQLQQVVQSFAQILNTPLYMPILAALERVSALTVQILMAVLVVKSVAQRKPLLWLAAFGIHTLLDAWAVYASQTMGVVVTEAGILLIAALAGWLLWRLREPPPSAAY